MGERVSAKITILVGLLLLLGLGGNGEMAPARAEDGVLAQAQETPDPESPGPYAVGATRRTFTRTSSTTGAPRPLDTIIWYPATPASVRPDAALAAPADIPPARGGAP